MYILEARSRIGGRIYTDDLLGYPIDLGASWVRGIDGNPLADVPIRLEGLSNVQIFDQKNRPLSPPLSRTLIDRVWAARERLIAASAAAATTPTASSTGTVMPPASLLSPTSPAAAAKRKKLRRRQSWWERRRLSALDDAASPELGVTASETETDTPRVTLGRGVAFTSEPAEDGTKSPPVPSPVVASTGPGLGRDISVRDWIMDEEEFCEDLNRDPVSRRVLLDLINVIE
ncbi:hypothetical protein HDU96_002814, partial [Phlyctochytrium bullatum]